MINTHSAPETPIDTKQTTCCIVGGGPAGAVLALLLARQGVATTLLELHRDFDREFRGDTLHPSVMEIMERLGLAESLLELPHTQLRRIQIQTETGMVTMADFSRLRTKYPYITLLPQVKFLEFIIAEAKRYPHFQLVMGANVQELVEEDGKVCGVRYRGHGGWHEVRSPLTVGADGRFSRLRQLGGFAAVSTSPPMDILWFRVSRRSGDPEGVGLLARARGGRLFVIIDRLDYWQLGYVIVKGSYQALRDAGIEGLRASIAELAPEFADRTDELQDWSQISMLSVKSDLLTRWYRPGLLLIGDAAHIMSPVGGVGINYAIQDAVVAANVLAAPLKGDRLRVADLAKVQRQRELPTRVIQTAQTFIQKRIIATALDGDRTLTPPTFLRLPVLRDVPANLIGFGIRRVYPQFK